jgi:hypothetical protein
MELELGNIIGITYLFVTKVCFGSDSSLDLSCWQLKVECLRNWLHLHHQLRNVRETYCDGYVRLSGAL